MQDDRFEQFLRDASQSYNRPPSPDAERMWTAIEAQHFDAPQQQTLHIDATHHTFTARRTAWWNNSWLRVAAALLLGVGLGRATLGTSDLAAPPAQSTVAVDEAAIEEPPMVTTDAATLRYIGQTVALLASFDSDPTPQRSDTTLAARAKELLLTTRLLLDAQQASDPVVYTLLEDLELVLVQIVQMPPKRNASDVDLIKEAMQQRDVMPRLIAAATTTTSAE